MNAWVRQWDRVLRWNARLSRYISAACDEDYDEQEFEDLTVAAFVMTYHLKDHLEADPSTRAQVGEARMERYITDTDSLAYCADIANGSKHLVLTKKPRRTPEVSFFPTWTISLEEATGEVSVSERGLRLSFGDRSADPLRLLTVCILDWEHFLVERACVMREDWRTLRGTFDLPPPREPS